MNYASLVQAIQDYTSNTEDTFVNNIPVFVQVAEQRIYNAVQIPALRKSVTSTLIVGNKYLTLPIDWLAMYEMAVVTPITLAQTYLLPKDVSFIRESFPLNTDQGTPGYYAIFSPTQLLLGPTPDFAYDVELHYFYYPESIITASNTWLSTNFDSVLLYGALREAYVFMKGEEDITAMYEGKYQEALALLKQLGETKNRRDDFRNGMMS